MTWRQIDLVPQGTREKPGYLKVENGAIKQIEKYLNSQENLPGSDYVAISRGLGLVWELGNDLNGNLTHGVRLLASSGNELVEMLHSLPAQGMKELSQKVIGKSVKLKRC